MTKVTDKQLKEWEAKYEVYDFPVDDKIGYLRAPDMNDYKRAFAGMQKNGEIGFGEEMLAALWLGGDPEIQNDDAYFLPARKELLNFFNYTDPEITKLGDGKNQIKIGDNICVVRTITRTDIQTAEKKNPGNKAFVTQENLFKTVCLEKSEGFEDRRDAAIRFPLYQAIEKLQNEKTAILKKRSPRP